MNERSSTFSSYDVDLHRYDLEAYYCDDIPSHICHRTKAVFSVNRYTMLAAHDFLIPRAVGYSTGLINYFFRGEIDLAPDSNTGNPGGYLIKNLNDEEISGTLTLYYDDVNDTRHLWQLWSTNGILAAKTGRVAVPAFPPPGTGDPAPKYPGKYVLVLTGTVGEESDTVIAKVGVNAAASGMILTAGGDASGFARPGDGGAVTIETGVSRTPTSPATLPLIVAAGDTLALGGGLHHYSEIAILGTLELTADTVLRADGPVGISGTVEGYNERDGVHLTIESGDVIAVSGTIKVAGRSGPEMGSGDQPGGNGGSVTLRTASADVFSVPTIITRGGDAALTDRRTPAKTFTGGAGGSITLTATGVADELAFRFAGTERPTTAVDTMPSQQGAHTLPSTTTFRRGLLTTGGYGGQFKGPDGELGVTVTGTAGGTGGNITITCALPSTLQLEKTDLFTGGNIDVLLTYTRQAVFSPGTRPRLTNFFQRTGAMGGQGSSGQTHTHGGTGGSGGAAGAITINTCQLATPPASFTSPPRVAPLILGGNVVTGLVTAPRPRIIDAVDASGTRLYSLQAFGGGGGLPGGSGLSLARCSKTGAQCYIDDIPACPLAPDNTAQICLPVAGGTGSPGNWGSRGADGPVSCGPLMIPSTLVGTGLVCQ
ncbi:MAG: hypothetical protein EXR78_04780 [Deltaproteobacteria bacterium]|nr:hypothetical protein [Deltaproteobacteria bacterium]